MQVMIRFYSSYRDIVGTGSITMELEEGTTLGDLVEMIRNEHPRLRSLTDEIVVSLNKKALSPDTILSDGDEVSFLPPLTGG